MTLSRTSTVYDEMVQKLQPSGPELAGYVRETRKLRAAQHRGHRLALQPTIRRITGGQHSYNITTVPDSDASSRSDCVLASLLIHTAEPTPNPVIRIPAVGCARLRSAAGVKPEGALDHGEIVRVLALVLRGCHLATM